MKNIPLYNILLTGLLLIGGCRKSDRDIDNALNSVQDNALAESVFTGIFKMADQAARFSKGIVSGAAQYDTLLFACGNITTDTLASPMKMEISFPSSCKGNDAMHSGILNLRFYGKYDTAGSKILITTKNYTYNEMPVSAEIEIRILNIAANGKPVYQLEVKNGRITNQKNLLKWACSWNLVMEAGAQTQTVSDDQYAATGSANGYAFKGNAFEAIIAKALQIDYTCRHATAGKNEVKPSNLHTRRVDYGNGTCTGKVLANINGKEYEVLLP